MSIEDYTKSVTEKRKLAKEAKEVYTKLNAEAEAAEKQLMEAMKEQGLDSFKNDHGSFSIASRFSVRLPETTDDWNMFWEYTRSIGAEETLKTVNASRLNAWFKQEMDEAVRTGNIDFKVPGLKEAKSNEYLTVRKV